MAIAPGILIRRFTETRKARQRGEYLGEDDGDGACPGDAQLSECCPERKEPRFIAIGLRQRALRRLPLHLYGRIPPQQVQPPASGRRPRRYAPKRTGERTQLLIQWDGPNAKMDNFEPLDRVFALRSVSGKLTAAWLSGPAAQTRWRAGP